MHIKITDLTDTQLLQARDLVYHYHHMNKSQGKSVLDSLKELTLKRCVVRDNAEIKNHGKYLSLEFLASTVDMEKLQQVVLEKESEILETTWQKEFAHFSVFPPTKQASNSIQQTKETKRDSLSPKELDDILEVTLAELQFAKCRI
ncbi:MAG: hypothetical protein A3F12_03745 [Gammaproteobacteria bacterium RIFCSPHIGHO2_12_FULL_38_14]|nr:MAG: hypothetical protein A3F12_03745 [Gammaproteobacteria bacterium RIFCSPHIGHO2_12_FULL_38_14]